MTETSHLLTENLSEFTIEHLPALPEGCTPSFLWKIIPALVRTPEDFDKKLIWDLNTDKMVKLSKVLGKPKPEPYAEFLLIVNFMQFQMILPCGENFLCKTVEEAQQCSIYDPKVQKELVCAWPVKMKEPHYYFCMKTGPKTVRICDFAKELATLHQQEKQNSEEKQLK